MSSTKLTKKLRFLVKEWDKRKQSELLTDHLVDIADKLYDDNFQKYTKMADEKRREAVAQRKKEQDMLEYRNEKKRSIPTWPEKVPYSKFKPDFLSWNLDYFLGLPSLASL